MNIFFSFAPFFAYLFVERVIGVLPGLVLAAAVSFPILMAGKPFKLLDMGTTALFGLLAAYTYLTGTAWSIIGIRLCVDSGLLAIVLLSILIGKPFTLQYARETAPREVWFEREFLRKNYVISAVWALAFTVMVLADLVLLKLPPTPPALGVAATVIALAGAIRFTSAFAKPRTKVSIHV